jgi:formate dehydrogenase major subunit
MQRRPGCDLLRLGRDGAQPGIHDGDGYGEPRHGNGEYRDARRGVNPLRGQNNVQGSCDMGSFPHEFSGYRHVSEDAVREMFEQAWQVALEGEPGCGFPTCWTRQWKAPSWVCTYRVRTSRSRTRIPVMSLRAVGDGMRGGAGSVPERDGKLRARFLPGSSFLEKDGTFTNAERRISRYGRSCRRWRGWQTGRSRSHCRKALGYPMRYAHPSEIMDEIARLTPTFAGVSYREAG